MSTAYAGKTVAAARRELTAQLRAHGIDSAELDARLLAGAALGLDLTAMVAAATRPLAMAEAACLEHMALRRLAGEPVARILGRKEFWGLPLRLSAATLEPRPDTETVVELALEMLGPLARPRRHWRIADIGTGSGAILLALLSEWPEATGVGTDLSAGALQTARSNAAQLGMADRAAFVVCDLAAALSDPFDLVVSNPPYVRSADIASLAIEVRAHDPHRALDGGADGLEVYRGLIPQAARLLAPDGVLVVEVGQGQSDYVERLMKAAGLMRENPPKADLAGIPRAVGGRKLPR